MNNEEIKKIKEIIKNAKRVVFLGGAGVSTASGIPDFRSPTGLYNVESKYGERYETMLSSSYFYSHTENFYDFYWSTMVAKGAKPNKAHYALADFEKRKPLTIITQNIDGLHQLAGSQHVLEVHGSTYSYHCLNCGQHYSLKELTPKGIPHCPKCSGLLKPDVVLYEEPLDEGVLEEAVLSLRQADVLIIGGTSMNVYPAAGLVNYFSGSTQIIINKEATPYDPYCDYVIHEDIGDILEKILGE